jgi:hypothetical protein
MILKKYLKHLNLLILRKINQREIKIRLNLNLNQQLKKLWIIKD